MILVGGRRPADAGRSSRRLRGSGAELDAHVLHLDPEAAMREIRRLRAAEQEAPPPQEVLLPT